MSRRTFGSCLLFAGFLLFWWHVILAATSFRDWWHWHVADPSGAELYALNTWFHSAGAAFGGLMTWLGRRLAKRFFLLDAEPQSR